MRKHSRNLCFYADDIQLYQYQFQSGIFRFLLADKHQHAVISDGVDDGVGQTPQVRLWVSVPEEEALEEAGGRALGSLGRLEISQWVRTQDSSLNPVDPKQNRPSSCC